MDSRDIARFIAWLDNSGAPDDMIALGNELADECIALGEQIPHLASSIFDLERRLEEIERERGS